MHAKMQPANSVIIRIVFTDLQGNELKRYNFNRSNAYFTVPAETIGYYLELINAGNEQIDFRRIEICEKKLSQDANQDLWFQEPMNAHDDQPMNLLVVPANRRTKKNYPELAALAGDLPVQVVLVDYQYEGNLANDLASYLRHHGRFNDQVVSCDPRYDIPVLNLQKELETTHTLITNTHQERLNLFNSRSYELPKIADWANSNTVEPNWRAIVAALPITSGGE